MDRPLPFPNPEAPEPPPGMDDLPYSDGEPMESEKHVKQLMLLVETLQRHFADRPDVYVAGDMAVYYSVIQARNQDFKAPDVFVVLGAKERDVPRKSWVIWEEERGPDVVMELLSSSTEANDRGPKKTIYAQNMKVTEYYLFDPNSLTLEGFTLDLGRRDYRAMRKSSGGYASSVLNLRLIVAEGTYLGLTTEWLRWATADGALLPTAAEAADAATAKADAATAKADAATAKADAATAKADAATAKADAATAKADAATAKADAANAKAARLAAKLRAAGIDPDE